MNRVDKNQQYMSITLTTWDHKNNEHEQIWSEKPRLD